MESLESIIILYVGVVLLNTALSALLWARSRTPLHRSVFLLWASTVLSLGTQGGLDQNDLAITLGFSGVFLVNLSLAALIARISSQTLPVRVFVLVLMVAYAVSGLLFASGQSFLFVALPVAVAVAAPSLYVGLAALLRHRDALTFTGRGLTLSALFFVAHNLDFPFLRDKPDFAAFGFTIAILTVFALSIFAPAVVLEILTEKAARARAEMDVAARIQTEILPTDPQIDGLELECYMQPAEAVGGDYYDIVTVRDVGWILVGDVTGHGLSSGMVMLMAQSLISTVLHTREEVSPRELNFLANQVLFKNLQRLEDDRMMTIVSICYQRETGVFVVSGCHDDIFVFRAESGEVERFEMVDFPFGLGFIEDTAAEEFSQQELTLAPGDMLFIGTDGITEATRNGELEQGMFGDERLIEHIKRDGRGPLSTLKDNLLADIEEFTAGVYHDDITFVLARVQAEGTA